MRQLLQKSVDFIKGDTWPKRRLVIYAALIFCACVISYTLGAAVVLGDKESIRTASDNAWWYGSSFIFAYVFGSLADDAHKRFEQRKSQPRPPAEEKGE